MKKLVKTLAIVAVLGVILYAAGASADAGETVATRLAGVFEQVKKVFYVLAAFGLIGLAAAALLGKIQWKWLWALIFGVAIVAAAGYIVSFATSGGQNAGGINGITDTAISSS